MSERYRIEHDSQGELRIPADALYGAQTQRAVENFRISELHMPGSFIRALCRIKSAAAWQQHHAGQGEPGDTGDRGHGLCAGNR
jgi:fumarate hydratase class II